MMPKGVEHLKFGVVGLGVAVVRIPMMPKGVEHTITASYTTQPIG